MKKLLLAVPAITALLLSGSGCTAKRQQEEQKQIAPVEKSDLTESAYSCADSVIRTMNPERKAAQLFMPAVYASSDPYTLARIREYAHIGVGGLILLKGDTRSAAIIADSLAHWCETPPFIAIDAEWGLAMRLKDAPEFPVNSRISEDADEETLYEYGREMARECRRIGINMVLGPVLDITTEGTYIGRRSFGPDPDRVSVLSISYARGLESGNVMSVAKHFPGHGAASVDTHRMKANIDRSLQSLDSVDLQPFRRYIEQQLSGIMIGHLAFPAIDPQMLPAAVSRPVITDLLRTDLGFDGLVLTDAMNMLGAEGYGADKAVEAGADIILAPKDTRREIKNIIAAMERGDITEPDIDMHLRRILFKKFLLKAGYKPETAMPDSVNKVLNSPEAERIRKRLMIQNLP